MYSTVGFYEIQLYTVEIFLLLFMCTVSTGRFISSYGILSNCVQLSVVRLLGVRGHLAPCTLHLAIFVGYLAPCNHITRIFFSSFIVPKTTLQSYILYMYVSFNFPSTNMNTSQKNLKLKITFPGLAKFLNLANLGLATFSAGRNY